MSTAVVTGGSRGLGAATALALAEDGFDIVLTYGSRVSDAEAVAGQIRALGRSCDVRQVDLADSEAVEKLAATIASEHAPSVLVNNAGEAFPAPLSEVDASAAERLLRVNTLAPLLLTRGLAPALARGGGAVVNVSSIVAAGGSRGSAVYAASKAALHGVTTTLAVELAPAVRVNCVLPGIFLTDMNRERLAEHELAARVTDIIPLRRIGEPADCASVIAFLVSARARYVTGAVIPVDGGILARLPLP
ncbi:MAG: SDR family NAD(P)-dependent oxidoreductase [Gaiellales bacterium]